MSKADSKFSGLGAAIEEAKQQPHAAPARPAQAAPLTRRQARGGKRSDPAWRQHTVMLEEENYFQAHDLLRRQRGGQDLSELLNQLLGQWIKRQRND